MAAVTICIDFGAQKNKVCHCFTIYLLESDGTGCHDFSAVNPLNPTLSYFYVYYKWFWINLATLKKNLYSIFLSYSVQFSHSVMSDSLWPHERSTPGLPVRHQLLEFTQTHVHQVGDAIQPSHPLSSPSPPAPNPSQHQGLIQWVNSSHEAYVLEFQLQHQSFQWTPRTDLLQDGLVGSPCSPRTLKSFLQHHSSKASILWSSAFFTVQLSHPHMTSRKTIALTRWTFVGKVMSAFQYAI